MLKQELIACAIVLVGGTAFCSIVLDFLPWLFKKLWKALKSYIAARSAKPSVSAINPATSRPATTN